MSHIYFCDEFQLDQAIHRFSGSLSKISPERKKGLEISLTGIKVKLEESDKTRPLSIHERIELLNELLKQSGSLHHERPHEWDADLEFVKEKCTAVRVVVPMNEVAERSYPAFSFWVSMGAGKTGMLLFMEGTGGDSGNPYNYARSSSYTLLQSLVHFTRQQKRSGAVDLYIPNDKNPNEYAKVDETHTLGAIEQWHNVEGIAYDFVSDPLRLLESWKCDISSALDVEVLYRVREHGPEHALSNKNISVYGYALYICQAKL